MPRVPWTARPKRSFSFLPRVHLVLAKWPTTPLSKPYMAVMWLPTIGPMPSPPSRMSAFVAGDDQVAMLIEKARGHADDLRPLLLEHLTIIGVGVFGFGALLRRGAAFGVGVGHSHDLHVIERLPDGIEAVAVVAPARVPDDGDAIVARHGGPLCGFPTQSNQSCPSGMPSRGWMAKRSVFSEGAWILSA